MAYAGVGEMIVAGAKAELIERKISGEHERLFVRVVMVRGKFRAWLRADQEGDALALAIVPQQLALDARADELPLAFVGAHRAAAGRAGRHCGCGDPFLDALEQM